jgi:Zn-dependent peptidase ImmA (M78 family)
MVMETTQINIKGIPESDVAECSQIAQELLMSEQAFYRKLIHWASQQDPLDLQDLFTKQMKAERKPKESAK